MSSRNDHQTDMSHYAAGIARWDDEGGAPMSARSNTGVKVSKNLRFKQTAEATADLTFDQVPAEDEKILECLGAAVIMRWGTLPTKIQTVTTNQASASLETNRSLLSPYIAGEKQAHFNALA
jgi:hypothetical protein